jgi:hypothetical protein
MLIRVAALLAGTLLDEYFVPTSHQFNAGRGNKSDSTLAGLQLTGNSNTHGVCVLLCAWNEWRAHRQHSKLEKWRVARN